MTANELVILLRNTSRKISDNRERDVMRIGQEIKTLVQLRIQTRGQDSTGQEFESYTPGTKRQRKKKGFQTGYVDLTQTGRMWANIRPTLGETGNNYAKVIIKAQSNLNQIKLGSFAKKRSNPLIPTQDELDIIKQVNRKRLENYLIELQ